MTQSLKGHIEKTVNGALSRFGDFVRTIRVSLEDINGPKGGEDIRCRINARLASGDNIVIEETRRGPFEAVSKASGRVRRNVARKADRVRTQARRRGAGKRQAA